MEVIFAAVFRIHPYNFHGGYPHVWRLPQYYCMGTSPLSELVLHVWTLAELLEGWWLDHVFPGTATACYHLPTRVPSHREHPVPRRGWRRKRIGRKSFASEYIRSPKYSSYLNSWRSTGGAYMTLLALLYIWSLAAGQEQACHGGTFDYFL